MKQVNFDALRQIKAPEELINRTIQAAQEQSDRQDAAVYVPSMRRRLAIAASIVLVLGVSIFVYFSVRNINNAPVLVAPASAGTEPTEEADSPTRPDGFEPASGLPTEPTAQDRTETATVPTSDDPTAQTSAPQTEATVAPIQPSTVPVIPTEAPTAPVIPTEAPTELVVPTDPPVIEPTDSPEPWEPPFENPTGNDWPEPIDPTEPSTDEPISLRASFRSDLLTGSGKVYCAIYENLDHELIGGDRFSSAHEARIVDRVGDKVVVAYETQSSLFPAWKMYRVVFYNEDGEDVYASGRYLP